MKRRKLTQTSPSNHDHILNRSGFSLLEVLIAISILSFISIGIIAFTDSSIDTSLRVTEEDNESLQIETAMSRMEWDLSQVYSPLYFDHFMDPQGMTPAEGEIYNELADYYQGSSRFSMLSFNGLPVPIFQNPEKSSLIFLTTSNRRKMLNVKQSHFAWVKYELLADNLIDELNAKRELKKTDPLPTDLAMIVRRVHSSNIYGKEEVDWENTKSQILMRKVQSLNFEFWNPQGKKWVSSLDIIKDGAHKFHAVRVTIKYLDPDDVEVTSVRIFRPNFPKFKPEDMYKFLKATTPAAPGTTEGGGAPAIPPGDDIED